ncbi:MAG TPA: BadF/BadG/BcrA/BcrD ATPase family protein [Anaerolineae bacterium]|nr:BadF/BadG/BcrA/BcrD ATPase family protein [Anaerolineae bacterium]
MSYYLGIDIGATKSHALLADEHGCAAGFGEGGPGNHEVVGYTGLTATLQAVTDQALADAGIRRNQIAGAGFGVAGYDWPSELPPTLDSIATLGLAAPLEVVNDTIIGLVAGAEAGWGVGVIAGTSNNCWGWDAQHRIGRVTGNGSMFGEHGGSGELVQEAIAAVARAWTRRGPPTALTGAFCRLVGASSDAELLEGLSQGWYDIGAPAAPLIFQMAEAGDAVALGVVRWAAVELAGLANGVIRQLNLENQAFDVVLVGSMYNGGPLLLDPMAEAVQAVASSARFVRLTVPPVVGAVLLGMQSGGLPAQALRHNVIASTQRLMAERRNP